MGERGRWRIRFALLVLAILAVLLLLRERDSVRGRRTGPAAEASSKAPPEADGRPRAQDAAPRDPGPESAARGAALPRAEEWGRARFQHRLVAGRKLLELRRLAEAGEISPGETHSRYLAIEPYVLEADGLRPGDARPIGEILVELTEPPRDLDALRLPARRHGDLGNELLVRVWSGSGEVPRGEIDEGEGMVRHLLDGAGVEWRRGFDVLYAPDLGRERFPRLWAPEWAAGVYLDSDRVAIVDSDLRADFRPTVLRHELVHAFFDRCAPDVVRRTFLAEGLAEYLRESRRGDRDFGPPPERFRDEMAELDEYVAWATAQGASFDGVRLSNLLRMWPEEFYSLRRLGYAVALAAVAFAGPERIADCVRSNSDLPLVDAVHGFDWNELMRFVKRIGASGDARRAKFGVEDAMQRRVLSPVVRFRLALRRAGVAPGSLSIEELAEKAGVNPGQVGPPESALRMLSAPADAILLLTDLSDAMDGPYLISAEEGRAESPLGRSVLGVTRRRDLVRNLAAAFGARFGALARRETGATSIEDRSPLSLDALGTHLRPWHGRRIHLVLCIAGRDELNVSGESHPPDDWDEETWFRFRIAAPLRTSRVEVGALLVVDLRKGESDAPFAARAFADSTDAVAAVALWTPATAD